MVSTRGHYSLKKAASVLGIGEENVINIPVDDANRMDLRSLYQKIRYLKGKRGSERTKIIAVVGIAGTTETGNVDNLQKIGEACRQEGAHFHVDACWGGSALLVDEYRPLFRGIERADSVTIDAHKLTYCPMTIGMVLFRNERDLNTIMHTSNYIIRRNSVDMGRFTVEGSRPFACLKPWASLKIIGKEGYGLLFRGARETTKALQTILEGCGNFEILNDPELFILNYRFLPRRVAEQFARWEVEGKSSMDKVRVREIEKGVRKVNHVINGLNIKLHKALRRDDTTFVSRTTLESTRYRPQNIVVLRAVLINPLTDRAILEEIVETQNRIGLEIWAEFTTAYQRVLEGNSSAGRSGTGTA